MVPSHDNNHSVSRLECLADIFNNSIQLIWNYKEVEGQSSISLMPQRICEKLDHWKRKAQAGNFVFVRESCHGGWWWSGCWCSIESCSHLGGFGKKFALYFPEIIKTNLDLVKIVLLFQWRNVVDCMKDELIDLRNKSGANVCVRN